MFLEKRIWQFGVAISAGLALGAPLASADDHHWHGGDIHHFHDHDEGAWRGGRWFHGVHGERAGWWWIVGGDWYFYPAPVYPYPDPLVPPVVVAPAPAPNVAYWYYCPNPAGYYPYVPSCPTPWQPVRATPPN
jgi:hypothetical protein